LGREGEVGGKAVLPFLEASPEHLGPGEEEEEDPKRAVDVNERHVLPLVPQANHQLVCAPEADHPHPEGFGVVQGIPLDGGPPSAHVGPP